MFARLIGAGKITKMKPGRGLEDLYLLCREFNDGDILESAFVGELVEMFEDLGEEDAGEVAYAIQNCPVQRRDERCMYASDGQIEFSVCATGDSRESVQKEVERQREESRRRIREWLEKQRANRS